MIKVAYRSSEDVLVPVLVTEEVRMSDSSLAGMACLEEMMKITPKSHPLFVFIDVKITLSSSRGC